MYRYPRYYLENTTNVEYAPPSSNYSVDNFGEYGAGPQLKYLLIQIFTSLPDKSEELLKVNLVVAKKNNNKSLQLKINKALPLHKINKQKPCR